MIPTFAAYATHMRPIAGMTFQVQLQIIVTPECLRTNFTLIWLLSAVPQLMFAQIPLVGEGLIAQVTLIRFNFSMFLDVFCQLRLLGVTIAACGADMGCLLFFAFAVSRNMI